VKFFINSLIIKGLRRRGKSYVGI